MLGFQGWGQVTSISLSQPTICFGDATARLVINSNSDTWIFVERYDYSTSQWVTSNNPRQKVSNGVPLNFSILDFYNTAIYRVNYASSQATTLAAGTQFLTESTLTVRPEFTSGTILTTSQTICYGGTPGVIGSSTAASGGDGTITYSWRSSADGYITAISGATTSTYTPPSGLTSTTSYRRYANDGTCNTTPTVSTGTWTVTVNALPTATINAGSATIFCAGSSVTLTSSTGTSYLWSNGATTQSISLATAGSYTVTITNVSGCSATSSATTVTVNPLPTTPTVTSPTICDGNSATLLATATPTGTYTYTWTVPTGVTAPGNVSSFTSNKAGTYSVKITNNNGCTSASAS